MTEFEPGAVLRHKTTGERRIVDGDSHGEIWGWYPGYPDEWVQIGPSLEALVSDRDSWKSTSLSLIEQKKEQQATIEKLTGWLREFVRPTPPDSGPESVQAKMTALHEVRAYLAGRDE